MKIAINLFLFFILFVSFTNCKGEFNKEKQTQPEDSILIIDTITVNKSKLVLDQNKGIWYYNNKPFNGFSEKFNKNGKRIERLGFYNGKREGVAKTWSQNGALRVESYYSQNKLVGVYKSWWENGVLSLKVNYSNGLKQGEEKQWFPNGELSKLRQLIDGREDGLQKAWLANGKLYVNYEAKNGRIFGMKRANSCYKLENEKIVKK